MAALQQGWLLSLQMPLPVSPAQHLGAHFQTSSSHMGCAGHIPGFSSSISLAFPAHHPSAAGSLSWG